MLGVAKRSEDTLNACLIPLSYVSLRAFSPTLTLMRSQRMGKGERLGVSGGNLVCHGVAMFKLGEDIERKRKC